MTPAFPSHLLETMPPAQQEQTRQWWDALATSARQDFLMMWDHKAEDSAYFGLIRDQRIVWEQLPLELVGEFVEPEDAGLEHDEVKRQLLEYINNHEEFEFFLIERKFHICRAHPRARQVVLDGLIPHNFTCPLHNPLCPMLHILSVAPGKSVRLCARVVTKHA